MNSAKVIPFVIHVIVWGLRCVFVKQLPPGWLIIFLQLGKIIDEFSPIFPVAQRLKRQQCLLVAFTTMGDQAMAGFLTCSFKHSATNTCTD